MKKLTQYLFQKIDNSRLIAFRIVFGLVMAGECLKAIASGMVKEFYINSSFNFTFIGFEWLNVLHGKGMYAYYFAMVLLALFVAAGLLYRFSSFLLAVLWTATYLSQKTHYNNHYYLIELLCWLMAVMPANKSFAADVRLKITTRQNECYSWQIEFFIFQIACVYFFSAIAKMNSDWLHAIPLKQWLQHKTGLRFIGWSFRNPLMPWLVAYGGLLFDALIVPALLYRRTRVFAFCLSILFHAFNGYVFKIGSFPFLAVGLNVFFFPELCLKLIPLQPTKLALNEIAWHRKAATICVFAYVLLQLYLPFRHCLIKGDVMWTEEGHRMSWRMMLRSKQGDCFFKIVNKQNDSAWIINPDSIFNSTQLRAVAVLPDVTWQAAQFLKQKYAQQGMNVAVYAHSEVSLNFRTPKLLIDTACNLAEMQWQRWKHNEWILIQPE